MKILDVILVTLKSSFENMILVSIVNYKELFYPNNFGRGVYKFTMKSPLKRWHVNVNSFKNGLRYVIRLNI